MRHRPVPDRAACHAARAAGIGQRGPGHADDVDEDGRGTVRAVGRLISMGRRVGFSEASLFDERGRLCATATSTLIVL